MLSIIKVVPRAIRPLGWIVFILGGNKMNLEKAKLEFLRYTEPYKDLNFMCQLKINHTFRVMQLCEEIAKSLDLSKEDIEFAKYCGLLHDIGRFEQWRMYETFDDSLSLDHAKLGVDILKNDDYIEEFYLEDSYIDTLLNSVYYHNKYELSDFLSDRDKLFCNIVRDADKIDILYLCSIGHITREINSDNFSDKVFNQLLEGKQINRKDKITSADSLSISLGLVFGLNYDKSIEIIKKKDYMNQIINLYQEKTNNRLMQLQLEEVREVIEEYMKRSENYVREKI